MSFLPIFDRPNSFGEINCFLRRVVLQNSNSLLTGAESRVTLKLTPLKVVGHSPTARFWVFELVVTATVC